MKNTSLYINISSLLIVGTMSLSASLSSVDISNKVAEIKEERSGITLLQLEGTLSPFMIRKKKVEEPKREKNENNVSINQPIIIEEENFVLGAVLNRRAFINGKWYRQGDRISNYKVGHVYSRRVLLKSSEGNKQLKLKKKKKSFIKLNRGYR